MNTVRMRHPELDRVIEVPASAVPHHRAAGWVFDDSQGERPPCSTCGRPWPDDPPQEADEQTKAPAESGASSSEKPARRRRQSSEESE